MYIFSNRLSSNRFGSCNDTDLSVKLCVLEAAVIKNQVLGGISQDFLVHLVGGGGRNTVTR